MEWLKQSTAFTETIGPILDSTGAEYTGAVIGDLSISKNGTEAAMAAAATLTHISNGHYTLVGTTGNSDTLGRLTIRCNKSTYQMPECKFMVIPSTVYDCIVTNATNGTGGFIAATAAVSAAAGYVGSTGAAVNGTNANTLSGHDPGATLASQTNITAGTITTTTNLTNLPAITANWITAAGIADGAIDRATFAADTGLQSARSNTAQAGAAGTITLDASASATTDFYKGAWIVLTGGTGVGQTRLCTAYNGSTKVATVHRNWATNPDNTSTFAIMNAADIQGVVLVDTTTTNSDMRGTDNAALAATALSTATWTGTLATNLTTLASHDPGTTIGTSTLTQTQVTGGAYALNNASFAFNAALDFTTTQKAATLARVTLVDTATTVTNQLTAAQIATGVWQDATAGDFTTAGSIGKSLFTSGNAPGAASGLAIVGSNMGTTTSLTGDAYAYLVSNVGANGVNLTAADDAVITAIAALNNITAASVWAVGTRTITGGTITTYTGNTPQTGDAYAYLGTNVGLLGANLTAADDAVMTYLASNVGTNGANLTAADDAVLAAIAALNNLSSANVSSAVVTALGTALTEAYRTAGSTGSVAQLLYEISAHLGRSAIASTTKTLKKIDGSTTAQTYTLNDAATPTSIAGPN